MSAFESFITSQCRLQVVGGWGAIFLLTTLNVNNEPSLMEDTFRNVHEESTHWSNMC